MRIYDDSKSTCPDCDKNSDKHKANINKIVGAILAGAQIIEKKDSWDRKDQGLKEKLQRAARAANTYADEEA